MSTAQYDHLREQRRPADQDDLNELRAEIRHLGSIVAELADHAYWTEDRTTGNAENKAQLRELKEQAGCIGLGLVR